ncbi:TPA: divalent metal ion transporter [Candidatus Sumerlaeota bacterium]|nr:divalent metal ion transporter [Candidatus Sumerlaeota bacterium]
MRKVYRFSEGKLAENTDSDEGMLWVYINPDETEKRYLVEQLKLDEHTLNSSLDPDELSRLEFESDHMALIFKRPRNVSSADFLQLKVNSAGLFLFKERLIMVLPEDVPLFAGSVKALSRLPATPTLLMLGMIYRSISHFLEHLKVINLISGDLEQKINTAIDNKFLIGLFTLEKSLVYYLNAIHSNGLVIEKLRSHAAKVGLSPEETQLLDDIFVDNSQCYKQADIYSNILAGMMDARVSVVSNNLNQLMKTLNIIMLTLMAPTLIVSLFSMNMKHPLSTMESIWPFWIVVVLCFISVGSVFYFWKKNKW